MPTKTKDRSGWHQAVSITAFITSNFTAISSHIKAAIITLAIWGWVPIGLAEWINKKGDSGHE